MLKDNSALKIVVLGAAGQLGAALVEELSKKGAEPKGLARADLDITREEDISEMFESMGPDVVINCAAFVRVDDCEEMVEEAFRVNCLGPALIAAAARRRRARMVQVSTDYVFDGKKRAPYVESDRVNPINVYGASKLAGELAVSSQLEDHLIVRVAALFGGTTSKAGGSNFVTAVAKRAREKGRVEVVDDQMVSPTYAPYAARTIAGLIEKGAAGIVHAAGEEPVTWFEFAREVVAVMGTGAQVAPIKSAALGQKARRPANSALVSERLGGLSVDPPPSFREALPGYLASEGFEYG